MLPGMPNSISGGWKMFSGWSTSTLFLSFWCIRCHHQTEPKNFNYINRKGLFLPKLIHEYTQRLEKPTSKQWGFAVEGLDTACSVSWPSGRFPLPHHQSFCFKFMSAGDQNSVFIPNNLVASITSQYRFPLELSSALVCDPPPHSKDICIVKLVCMMKLN